MKHKILLSASFLLVAVISCSKLEVTETVANEAPVLPAEPYDYNIREIPKDAFSSSIFDDFIFPNPDTNTINNRRLEITPWGATLGRVLFYDKKLSLNNTVSCGTCHHQDKAFADGQRFSRGFEGRITERNSMAIANPIVMNNLFWDSRSKSIHDLSLRPVQNHIEMGMEDISRLETKLAANDYYKPLFQKAFGSEEVNAERISKALSMFVASITTTRSRFDEVRKTGNTQNLTNLEKMGMDLFFSDRTKCSTCHSGFNFSAPDGPFDAYGGGGMSGSGDLGGAANIGLDLVYKDNGRGNGRFKIPSLRNIALTAPYMHDGRFKTLEEVIDHYSHGIKPHTHLDPKFTDGKGNVIHPNYTLLEKQALVAFLKTLTDQEMIRDPKYSNPFKN
jgi:cytochrome c peroxidase